MQIEIETGFPKLLNLPDYLTLPQVISGVFRVAQHLVFCVMLC